MQPIILHQVQIFLLDLKICRDALKDVIVRQYNIKKELSNEIRKLYVLGTYLVLDLVSPHVQKGP